MKNKKGCVYFFKPIGLDYVKIGCTHHENPKIRLDNYKMYFPYGIISLGHIISNNQYELKCVIHNLFNKKNINGEWFDISYEDVSKIISKYRGIDSIQE